MISDGCDRVLFHLTTVHARTDTKYSGDNEWVGSGIEEMRDYHLLSGQLVDRRATKRQGTMKGEESHSIIHALTSAEK